MNLLAEHAALRAGTVALVDGSERWSWHRLFEEARAMACVLQRFHGVTAGDVVATVAGNSAVHVLLLHAVFLCGGVAAPLNTRLTPSERARQIQHLKPRLVISAVPDGENELPLDSLMDQAARADAAEFIPLPFDEDRGCSILFTSGTSGTMKAVPHTWRNHRASAEGSARNLGVRPEDNWLCIIPLFHIGGLAIVTRSLFYGTAMTVRQGFDADAILSLLRQGDITLLSLVPTMLQRMLETAESFRAADSPSMRAILLGGAAASQALWEEARRRELPVLGTYGLTETCSQVVTASPEEQDGMAGSAGRPIGGAGLQIRDEDGLILSDGNEGEIWIRGAMVSAGYLDDAARSRERYVDGWFRTGDIGSIDGAGCLHVIGRLDDMIVTGGENVYPLEIEDVLLRHSAVREAAVTGLPDSTWGRKVAAAVVLRDAVPFSELDAWCRRELAGYKIPRVWQQMNALPRTPSGKLRRKELAEMMMNEEGGSTGKD